MSFLKPASMLVREGLKHLQARRFDKAVKSLQLASRKKPQDPVILIYLSQAYAGLGDLDKAITTILEACELDPEHPTPKELHAMYLMRQGRHAEAIPIIDKVLEIQPSDILLVMRGQADYSQGNLDSAEVFFKRALELDSMNPLAHHMLALVKYQKGQFQEAIPHLETALSFGESESLRKILEDCKSKTGGGVAERTI